MDALKKTGCPLTAPMIICNTDSYTDILPLAQGAVTPNDALLKIIN
jgi:hypothetical protein